MNGRRDLLIVTRRESLAEELERREGEWNVVTAESADGVVEGLREGADCVVVDDSLSREARLTALSRIDATPSVLCGTDHDRAVLAAALDAGVDRRVEAADEEDLADRLAASVRELLDPGSTPASDASEGTTTGEWYRLAVAEADRPQAVLDADRILRVANDAFRERFGLGDGVVGRPFEAVLDAGVAGRLDPFVARALAGESVHVDPSELAAGDADAGDYEAHLYPLGADPVEGVGMTMRDVSQRQWAERRFGQFFRNMPTAGFVLDDRGVTVRVNDTFCERTGYDREEVVGKALDELPGIVPDADREKTIERFERLSEGETLPPAEIEYETKDGERRHAIVESVPLLRDGEFDRLIGISRDVTELKRRERELARQNERLEQFASIVSHDLRNPLQVATAELDLARRGDEDALDNLASALDRMEAIVDDVLTMAREGGAVEDPDRVSLEAVAGECWRHVDTRAATLTVDGDATIAADRSRLQELVENLYRNSVEHAGEDVQIAVGPLDDGRGFYVEDDGPGIPEDRREDVFEAGYTTAEDGTGFGLNIVEEIATAHDWSVTVTESDAGGARFEFTGVERA